MKLRMILLNYRKIIGRSNHSRRIYKKVFQQCKKAFEGITQKTATEEVCDLAKSQIGFGQSAVHKILKRHELPVNTLTRNAIKLWIEKNKDLNN